MATNTAAWVMEHRAYPFEIKPAPLGVPGDNQVLVKNHAIAVNPIEGKLQTSDLHRLDMKYPQIFGEDIAGEVVSVGPNVTSFKKGDRVAAVAPGFATKRTEEKAFQAYTVVSANMTAKIPDSMPFENAAVFPLGLCTASACLFNPDYLNLQVPTEPAQKATGKVLLVWGGASCVGSNAIQLAVAAGYEVISTASEKHFGMVKKLGASHVFDYHSPTVVADLLAVAKGKTIAGVCDAIGPGAHGPCNEFAQKADGVKFVATVVPGWAEPAEGVTFKQVFSLSIAKNHVANAVWVDYLPKALGSGSFVAATEPVVFGKGLESLQGAVDHLRINGASAQKVVVTL